MMDGQRFDALAKLISGSGTRRGVLGGVLGMLGTTLQGPVPAGAATADNRRVLKRRRKKRHKRTSQTTTPLTGTPPCAVCTLRNNTGECVPDISQNRETCAGNGTATSVCCNGECCHGCCDRDGA